MEYRKADVSDIDILIDFRKKQLVDEGQTPDFDIDSHLRTYFSQGLTDGSLVQYIAVENNENIATGGVQFFPFAPCWELGNGKTAFIFSMYTSPRHRKRGIARNILNLLIDTAKTNNCCIVRLQASDEGRIVYKKIGFTDSTSFMRLEF